MNGEAESTLTTLNESDTLICHIYKPLTLIGKGKCSDYKYRGLICRLFGFGASRDKDGNLRLATCKIIKEGHTENYESTNEAISNGMQVPIFTEY